jgi:hypothetical protein
LKIEKENHKKTRKMPTRLFYLLLFGFLYAASTAFLSTSTFLSKKEMRQTRGTPLAFVHDFLSMPIEPVVTTTTTFLDLNPKIKAEVLTNVSNVAFDFSALDFSGFITPSKSLYLSFTVVGRMLLLYMDWYVPGHSVPPEELAIQMFLLGANLKDLVRAAVSEQQA